MLVIKLKVAIQKANLHTQTVKELVTSEGSINAPFVNILCANTVTLHINPPRYTAVLRGFWEHCSAVCARGYYSIKVLSIKVLV